PLPEGTLPRAANEVVRLWGSDLRTHTTDERAASASARLGAVGAALDRLIARLDRGLARPALGADEAVLFSPHPKPWAGWPMAVRLAWPPGLVRGGLRVAIGEHEAIAQPEEVETYRDGGWGRALVVLA